MNCWLFFLYVDLRELFTPLRDVLNENVKRLLGSLSQLVTNERESCDLMLQNRAMIGDVLLSVCVCKG